MAPSVDEKKKLREELDNRVKEAVALRYEEVKLSKDSTQPEVLAALVNLRKRLDRIEGLYIEVSRIRAKMYTTKAVYKTISDDAWDIASIKKRKSSAVWGSDYSGKEERYAEIKREIMKELKETRLAEEMFTFADDAYKMIRTLHSGLDGTRQDLLAWLRTFKIESSMER
jgi:hypothetical protein